MTAGHRRDLRDPELHGLQDILPLEAYLKVPKPSPLFFFVPALVIGVLLQALLQLSPERVARGEASGELRDVVLAMGGAVFFAVVFTCVMWLSSSYWLQHTARQVYLGRAKTRTPVPEGGQWTHRLVANLDAPNWWRRIAGALFARRGQLVFVPQEINFPFAQGIRTIPIDASTTFTAGTKPHGPWTRLVGVPPLPLLVIRSGEREWAFLLPDAESAAEGLRDALRPGAEV